MILSRRRVLTGLIAAPIIVRPGILMPVRPLAPVLDVEDITWTATGGPLRWAVVWGTDHAGKQIFEKIELPPFDEAGARAVSHTKFRSVSSIESTMVIPGFEPIVRTTEHHMLVNPGDTVNVVVDKITIT